MIYMNWKTDTLPALKYYRALFLVFLGPAITVDRDAIVVNPKEKHRWAC